MTSPKLDEAAAARLVYSTLQQIRDHGSARVAINGAILAVAHWCVNAVVATVEKMEGSPLEKQQYADDLLRVLEVEAETAMHEAFTLAARDEELLQAWMQERKNHKRQGQ